jgi:hypothetical protein
LIVHTLTTVLADGDAHANLPLWKDYLQTQFDPAHLLSETGFTVVFDVVLGWLVWGKILKPRLVKSVHKEIDAEHGVNHEEHE